MYLSRKSTARAPGAPRRGSFGGKSLLGSGGAWSAAGVRPAQRERKSCSYHTLPLWSSTFSGRRGFSKVPPSPGLFVAGVTSGEAQPEGLQPPGRQGRQDQNDSLRPKALEHTTPRNTPEGFCIGQEGRFSLATLAPWRLEIPGQGRPCNSLHSKEGD